MLRDPAMVARLTPLVRSIESSEVDGETLWRWSLGGIDVLGASFTPAFTVHMQLDPMERIDFTPAPRPGKPERTAVTGWYALSDPADGSPGIELATSLEISLDLPLPRVARTGVEASMKRVIDGMGSVFAKNLLAHVAAER